jgi:transcription elongation factor Elf1
MVSTAVSLSGLTFAGKLCLKRFDMWNKHTMCPQCNKSDVRSIGVPKHDSKYRVQSCDSCGFVFTFPRPTPTELVAYYSSDYFVASDKGAGYADYYGIGEHNMRRMWPEYLQIAGKTPNKLLDVGSASGAFLHEALKSGVSVLGLELSCDAAERAINVHNVPTIVGDLWSTELGGDTFDAITMWHVLEHTIDPVGVIKRASSLLTENGTIFIELPQWNSLGRIVKGMRWAQLVPPAHINFWTVSSMKRLLTQNGFKVVHIQTVGLTGTRALSHRFASLSWFFKGVESLVESLEFGGYIRVLAVKADRAT